MLGGQFVPVASRDCDEICQVEQDREDLWFLVCSLHFFRSGLVTGRQAFRVRVEHTLPLTLHGSGAEG